MDEIGSDNRLRHLVPMPLGTRIIFIAGGAFAAIAPTLALYRGVWPLNLTTPFFLVIIIGGWSVGVPMAMAALTSPAVQWIVERGRIRLDLANPFGRRSIILGPAEVDRFECQETEWDSSAPTWKVTLVTKSDRRYPTRHFGTRAAAETFRRRIESLFRGEG